MVETGTSEHIIQNIVGCGPFQVVQILSVFIVTKIPGAFTIIFMSFGNLNPGWRCMDSASSLNHTTEFQNTTMDIGNSTVISNHNIHNNTNFSIGGGYIKDDCPAFDACQHVEFDPETSTIISEWGLLCGKAWIPSIMISLQMFGVAIGCFVAGFLGDAYGRKTTIYWAQAAMLVFNTIAIFSYSWQMFAALRFFLGVTMSFYGTLYYIYGAEFVTIKWRGVLPGFPYFPFIVLCFGITCFILKDWRHIQIVIAVLSFIGLVPASWLTESLRWLEVKNKTAELEKVATKIAKLNGKKLPSLDEMNIGTVKKIEKDPITNLFHDTLRLFKRGNIKNTLIITVPWFSVSIIYYGIAFGVKALSGNFYLNFALHYGTEVVFDFFLTFLPNIIGRKRSGVLFATATGCCLIAAACFHLAASGNTKTFGIVAFVVFGRISISSLWAVMMVITAELYPTVVRGVAMSWGNTVARVGGILAPVFIPNDDGSFVTCYVIMGGLAVICAGLLSMLPETRGKVLRERFEKEQNGDGDNTESNETREKNENDIASTL